jgi:hypothetical protein
VVPCRSRAGRSRCKRGMRSSRSLRRCPVPHPDAGTPLEELGVVPDSGHHLTRRDVLGTNPDLIAPPTRRNPTACSSHAMRPSASARERVRKANSVAKYARRSNETGCAPKGTVQVQSELGAGAHFLVRLSCEGNARTHAITTSRFGTHTRIFPMRITGISTKVTA